MAIEDDVLVVGGGLAGITAAIAGAREGATVRLVSATKSTLRQASGLIDVLGYLPDGTGPVVDPFDAVADLPEGHPYERAGPDALADGLALFDDLAGDHYRGSHTDRNALVPTTGGTVKPTARYPATVEPGLASREEATLLVGFEGTTDFEPSLAATHLDAAGVPFEVRAATVSFPDVTAEDATATRFAHLLDEDPGVRDRLAERVKPHLAGESRVGFPAVLGQEGPESVRTSLAEALGASVFEIPTGPPSVPGLRLENLLHDALADEGVRVEQGNPVVDFDATEDRVETVTVDRVGNRVPYAADQYVLATGGLVGGGVEADREQVSEPVFDCHVPHPADRYEWFEDDAFGEHAFARFGVDVDAQLRPLAADGTTEYENLRAAGAVLGGADFAAEKSGSGVSLATGFAAGRRAATELIHTELRQ
ncbi:glycerol-3-phosphate dehydrogenase subunit GlpB [Haloarculaceae archaeon H-GB2-1]|nr:glycerol-3-phosphate dehydrogenase subunit GlpB [Haloarculaceae archaeon H-GB1-1]MEA5408085.1 glycerol-3-phosphate dehydrogenase subunit GlpB [Haloarculaceae archaeon H-GB2-1]